VQGREYDPTGLWDEIEADGRKAVSDRRSAEYRDKAVMSSPRYKAMRRAIDGLMKSNEYLAGLVDQQSRQEQLKEVEQLAQQHSDMQQKILSSDDWETDELEVLNELERKFNAKFAEYRRG
jgi:hypothetical protein